MAGGRSDVVKSSLRTKSLCALILILGLLAAPLSAQVLSFEEAKERADAGDAFAQAVVALHYQLGWNTEKNPELAVKYARESANAGEPLGQFRLGALMRAGEGVAKDEEQGLAYQATSFNGLAAAQDPYSITSAAIMIFQGKVVGQGVPQDQRRKDAANLYKKAADMGYAPAQFNYAMALNDGHGVAKNVGESNRYAQVAASAGYPLAISRLLESLHALPSDPSKAAASSNSVIKTLRLSQTNLREGQLNSEGEKKPRLEVASFTGADVVLINEGDDFVIFADTRGKLERYSISSGRKMWSLFLPAGTAVEGLYLGHQENGVLYVVALGSNEVIHETSVWSLPLSGVGKARELAQFWEGGSESSAPGGGARVEGRYKDSNAFLINYTASDDFDRDGAVARIAEAFFPSMIPGQGYQMIFDASSGTLTPLTSSGEEYVPQNLESPQVEGRLRVFNGQESDLTARSKTEDEVELLEGGKTRRMWRRIPPGVRFVNQSTVEATSVDGERVQFPKVRPVELFSPSIFERLGNTPDLGGAGNDGPLTLKQGDWRISAEAAYYGGSLEVRNIRAGDTVSVIGEELLLGATYGSDVAGCWVGNEEALFCFSNGYFLLRRENNEWVLSKLTSEMLPLAEGMIPGEWSGEVLIGSQNAVYYAVVGGTTLRVEKAIFIDPDKGHLIVFPDGSYAGSASFWDRLSFADSHAVYPFEQFDLRLNRPDIVLERLSAPVEAVAIAKQLREKRLKRMGVTEEMLKPDFHVPELEIVGDVPATTDADEINLSIKASDSKYPLERLKVFVNNVPVNGRDGESLRDENTQTLERTIPIKLAAGRNKIQVSVLNNAGAESLYANAEVNCTAERPKPTLYAVAMGVSEYSNPNWNLKYAAKDARDVLARLKDKAGDSYGQVKELLLTDKEVTKESIAKIKELLKGTTTDDTVLMFVAGHGLLDSNYDYYFGTTDIDFNDPADKGIAFEEFDDLLAELPSLRKSLLIDTCHAGELDEEEKTLLASAGGVSAALPTANGVAVRSIGMRGMNVKAIEGARGASEWYDRLQGLFVDLRRGSGSTILSSSAGAEYALESSEQQNGLFTYAVLEALDGKPDADTDKDGSIEMSELGEYVKKRVSELTNNKQTPNTRRVNLEGDFTLAKTK